MVHTPGPTWYTNSRPPIGPHFQGLVADEVTGHNVAVTYDDEGGHKARLIAAAPELLAACERLAAWDRSHDDANLISEACSMARAAIAKARQ